MHFRAGNAALIYRAGQTSDFGDNRLSFHVSNSRSLANSSRILSGDDVVG